MLSIPQHSTFFDGCREKVDYLPASLRYARFERTQGEADRFSTMHRPSETVALTLVHVRGGQIPHGDLKCENILVTSTLSVYVTDFAASFKPTYLPLDDPADFSFFFDTSGRRTCYVAPERFYEADSEIAKQKAKAKAEAAGASLPSSSGTATATGTGLTPTTNATPAIATGSNSATSPGDLYTEVLGLGKRDGKVTEAMDVFSLGCVIAELWRDGAPIFTLSQLFKYREGAFDIEPALAEIADPDIRVSCCSGNLHSKAPGPLTFEVSHRRSLWFEA